MKEKNDDRNMNDFLLALYVLGKILTDYFFKAIQGIKEDGWTVKMDQFGIVFEFHDELAWMV